MFEAIDLSGKLSAVPGGAAAGAAASSGAAAAGSGASAGAAFVGRRLSNYVISAAAAGAVAAGGIFLASKLGGGEALQALVNTLWGLFGAEKPILMRSCSPASP